MRCFPHPAPGLVNFRSSGFFLRCFRRRQEESLAMAHSSIANSHFQHFVSHMHVVAASLGSGSFVLVGELVEESLAERNFGGRKSTTPAGGSSATANRKECFYSGCKTGCQPSRGGHVRSSLRRLLGDDAVGSLQVVPSVRSAVVAERPSPWAANSKCARRTFRFQQWDDRSLVPACSSLAVAVAHSSSSVVVQHNQVA